jgi:small subunit ribosomal protein S2
MVNNLNITTNQLIAADLFLGYHVTNWNPRVNFFLLGKYRNTNIFNINYTYSLTKKFIAFISDLFSKKGHLWVVNEGFLFKQNSQFSLIASSFPEINFLTDKWCKGMLSNYKHVLIVKPDKFPHAIFVPNIQNNHFVINEAFIINIPSWGICDSQDNPANIFFPIPGNSKSLRSLYFFFVLIAKTVMYSRYIVSSSFVFKAFSSSKNLLKSYKSYYKVLKNNFLINFFSISKRTFLVDSLLFLIKGPLSLRKQFSFIYRKKFILSKGLRFLKWKFPLLFITNLFKNILQQGLFNIIKSKNVSLIKKVWFFKTLSSIIFI